VSEYVLVRYDPDLARFEDPSSAVKPDDEAAFKFCPSCVRIRQKQLVRSVFILNLLLKTFFEPICLFMTTYLSFAKHQYNVSSMLCGFGSI